MTTPPPARPWLRELPVALGALGQTLEGLDQEFVFLASGKGFGNARRII